VKSSNTGITALIKATQNQNLDSVRLLLENKANVNNTDDVGETALFYAVDQVNNKTDDEGESTLFSAVESTKIEIIHLLLEKNANLYHVNIKGDALDAETITKLLSQNQAVSDQADAREKNSLSYAEKRQSHSSIIHRLGEKAGNRSRPLRDEKSREKTEEIDRMTDSFEKSQLGKKEKNEPKKKKTATDNFDDIIEEPIEESLTKEPSKESLNLTI
jgi:ankyrin repeat protein